MANGALVSKVYAHNELIVGDWGLCKFHLVCAAIFFCCQSVKLFTRNSVAKRGTFTFACFIVSLFNALTSKNTNITWHIQSITKPLKYQDSIYQPMLDSKNKRFN